MPDQAPESLTGIGAVVVRMPARGEGPGPWEPSAGRASGGSALWRVDQDDPAVAAERYALPDLRRCPSLPAVGTRWLACGAVFGVSARIKNRRPIIEVY